MAAMPGHRLGFRFLLYHHHPMSAGRNAISALPADLNCAGKASQDFCDLMRTHPSICYQWLGSNRIQHLQRVAEIDRVAVSVGK